jgi:hypothetical protein
LGIRNAEWGIGNAECGIKKKELKTHMNIRGPVFVTPRLDYVAAGSTFAGETHETVCHAEARAAHRFSY